jgi:hypothetical protein
MRREGINGSERTGLHGATLIKDSACESISRYKFDRDSLGRAHLIGFSDRRSGLELDLDAIPGLREAVGSGSASTDYTYDNAARSLGWVEVDQYTLQHKRYSNIFALGDVANTPHAKTGAAAIKQAPVVVNNLLSVMRGSELTARYDGYVAYPITTAYGKLPLCEFDYTGKPTPTLPFINTIAERYDTWLLKR